MTLLRGRTLVPLGNYRSLTEAGLAQTKLASEGIPCEIPDRYSKYRAFGGGGISVYVRRDDYRRAAAVLHVGEDWVDMDEYVDSDDDSVPRCPECRSASVACEPLSTRRWLVTVLLAGIPLFFTPRHWTCHKCSHAWTRKTLLG